MTTDDREIVSALRLALADKVGGERFDLWFGSGTTLALVDGVLSVRAASQFKLDWLRKHFRDDIEGVCGELLEAPRVEFRVDPTLQEKTDSQESNTTAPAAGQPSKPARHGADSPESSLRRRRFANLQGFVVGDSNRIAHTSAQMVAQQPGEFNPLLFHGPPGVGKTHLLEGIWTEARRTSRMQRTVYLSAEQFTSYFLEALRGSGLPNFRRKYRGLDLLIIDDVQFFAGKRATLVELLHTIDTLLREGRQLVFAASRPPAQLGALGPELTTRLTSGLVCGVGHPDMASRRGIVEQLVRLSGMRVPPAVLDLIASNLSGDARQLRGAVCRLRAASEALQQPITLAMAETALSEMIRAGSEVVRLADIERAVCDVLGMEVSSLHTNCKAKRVSHPRMLAMWLARKHTRSALSEIGQYFGHRSHTTVISAQKKVNGWMAQGDRMQLADRSWNIDEAIRQIEGKLRTG